MGEGRGKLETIPSTIPSPKRLMLFFGRKMDDSGGGRRGSKYPLNEYVNTRSGEQALASSRKLVGRVICARRVPYPKEIWMHLDTGPSL